jgi:tetratricopeptide (TPR) repeat protein
MSGDFERALELAESCHDLATIAYNKLDDNVSQRHRIRCVISLAQACWSIGNVLFHQAQFDKALPHMNRCLSFCDTIDVENRPMAQDPAVMCLAYKSWHYWECGAPDQALATVEAAVDLARRGGRSFSIGLALAFHACIHLFRQEYSAVIVIASKSIAICEEPGFCTWLAWAKVLRGRALSAHADTRREGIAEIQDGLKMWDESGAIATRAFTLALLAEACQLDGQQATAFRYITEARHFVEHYGERYYEAEINRIYANLLLSYSPADTRSVHDMAVDVFTSAVSFASERGMHSSVVRSMTDLCRVKCRVEPDLPSMNALQVALAAMSDGDDTGDIRAARQLLRTLEISVRRDSTCE